MDILNALAWIAVLAAVLALPTFLLRWLSGWPVLEQLYGNRIAAHSISRGSFCWVRSRFGWVRVGLCVEFYDDGLWMRMHFPVNLITSPVMLPWTAVHLNPLRSVLLARRVELRVDGFSKPIRFIGDPSGALLQRYEKNCSTEEPSRSMRATCEDARE